MPKFNIYYQIKLIGDEFDDQERKRDRGSLFGVDERNDEKSKT